MPLILRVFACFSVSSATHFAKYISQTFCGIVENTRLAIFGFVRRGFLRGAAFSPICGGATIAKNATVCGMVVIVRLCPLWIGQICPVRIGHVGLFLQLREYGRVLFPDASQGLADTLFRLCVFALNRTGARAQFAKYISQTFAGLLKTKGFVFASVLQLENGLAARFRLIPGVPKGATNG